jgi:hypothetical protein
MNIEKVYSRQEPSLLLHILVDAKGFIEQRQDLTPAEQWLQVSLIPLVAGTKIQAHIHQERQANIPKATITQESWFVVRGSIVVRLYDLDKTAIHEGKLDEGGMLITFHGGHSMEALHGGAVVMETKNGPYSGKDFVRI